MRDYITKIQSWDYNTLGCCCGHDKYRMTVVVETPYGNVDFDTSIPIPRKTHFYKRDKDGIFYIPEIEGWRDIHIDIDQYEKIHKFLSNRIPIPKP